MPILPFKDKYPIIPDSVYVSPNAYLIGDLEIGENSSFWFNVTVRADVNYITDVTQQPEAAATLHRRCAMR
jgi:carbonic anhydrase/acetyltransferase-like protein (isoleucine patch superfamily)